MLFAVMNDSFRLTYYIAQRNGKIVVARLAKL